jgi:hypothetical protein
LQVPEPIAASPPASSQVIPRLTPASATAQSIGRVAFTSPEWAESSEIFKPAAGASASASPAPIFQPRRTRALLGAAFSTTEEGSELDVARAIAMRTTRLWFERIPFRRVLSLRRGLRLCVDEAEGMNPFRHDVDALIRDLHRLFGRGRLSVARFADCPSRGIRTDSGRIDPWQPPPAGTPVAVLSDVGISAARAAEAATGSEWRTFARGLAAAGCPLVVLIPFAPSRWPAALARSAACLHWSERTTVRHIVRALGDARRSDRMR